MEERSNCVKSALEDSYPVAIGGCDPERSQIRQPPDLTVHEDVANRPFADANRFCGLSIPRDDEGMRSAQPEVGCECIGLPFERQLNPAAERVLGKQGANVRVVFAVRDRKNQISRQQRSAAYAALSKGPFQAGSPSGK